VRYTVESRVLARVVVNGEERETREVSEKSLAEAATNRENVLLENGNPYRIVHVEFDRAASQLSARVDLEAPRFARGG
jgi:hypothetical protein